MYIKVTQSGSRRYVQLVQAFRDDDGKPRQRTVATLGRLDQLGGEVDALINGLLRATGRSELNEGPDPSIRFDSSKAFGDLWALHTLWCELGFSDALKRLFRRTRHGFDVEELIRLMVFHRLCDPDSKLGVLRWLDTVTVPAISQQSVTHQRLLRAMDALQDQRDSVASMSAALLRPLIDDDVSVVFYDLTTLHVDGASTLPDDLRAHGKAKSGLIERQCLLGVVQTSDGLPIAHQVWPGNQVEAKTLQSAIESVVKQYRLRRVILVADRGLLNIENVAVLQSFKTGQEPLQFIVAVPARRYVEFAQILEQPHQEQCLSCKQEVFGETTWHDTLRLVWAHDPAQAAKSTEQRRAKIAELEQRAQQACDKLDAQDQGMRRKGRKLSDQGAAARLYHDVLEARLAKIIHVNLGQKTLSWSIDEQQLARDELLDGKLLVLTNVPDKDLNSEQIIRRYKGLADIERGFRVLKSDIEITPMYHRLPQRIQAHATICFFALILHRIMRSRLKQAGSPYSPDHALQMLRTLQQHRVHLSAEKTVTGLSTITPQQTEIYVALKVSKPGATQQLPLL